MAWEGEGGFHVKHFENNYTRSRNQLGKSVGFNGILLFLVKLDDRRRTGQ